MIACKSVFDALNLSSQLQFSRDPTVAGTQLHYLWQSSDFGWQQDNLLLVTLVYSGC